MNRPVVSYSDLPGRPRGTPPSTLGDGAHHVQPHHKNKMRGGRAFSGNGQQGAALGKRKRDRKFKESANNVHWDAQGAVIEGSIQVDYGDEETAYNPSIAADYVYNEPHSGIKYESINKPSQQQTQNGTKRLKLQSTGQKKLESEERVQVALDGSWDDSALIEAWDAAMEEYKILNGNKDWKTADTEPVHKHSIWYTASEVVAVADALEGEEQGEEWEEEGDLPGAEEDEIAAELTETVETGSQSTTFLGGLPNTVAMSPEEIFQKAVEASYWAGYWAGAYNNATGKKAVSGDV